jgi:hypothetical protein
VKNVRAFKKEERMADGEVSVVGKDINAAKATNTYEVLA